MYRKILVPLDGSDTAERGLHEAIRLAAELKSGVLLLNVITEAEQVVRHSPVPVLLVRSEQPAP